MPFFTFIKCISVITTLGVDYFNLYLGHGIYIGLILADKQEAAASCKKMVKHS